MALGVMAAAKWRGGNRRPANVDSKATINHGEEKKAKKASAILGCSYQLFERENGYFVSYQ